MPGSLCNVVCACLTISFASFGCGDSSDGEASPTDHPSAGGGGPGGAGGSGVGAGGLGVGGGAGGEPYDGPTRYEPSAELSVFTASVAQAMQAIAARSSGQPDVFMKIGASGTVSTSFLHCFAGDPSGIVLDGNDALWPTLEAFLGGDAAGATPFDRDTLAAMVGQSAGWAIGGDPSPWAQEAAALNPLFALVNYGTNDMQLGATYGSALFPFYEDMSTLLDELEAAGIVPIVTGLNPRTDSDAAGRWVPTYDAVTRGLAEARQLPYISLYHAMKDLPDQGMSADGIHGNVFMEGGAAAPCVFTAAGLSHNYNRRNLLTARALDGAYRLVVGGEDPPDVGTGWAGDGTHAAPIEVDALPFTHAADTSASPEAMFDTYPRCDGGQDESGPEVVYRLDLARSTPIRIALLDRGDVDVDLHLLGADLDASSCILRDDRMIEATLPAGTYHVVVDTYVGADVYDGAYLLTVVECAPGDPACQAR